MSSYTKWQMWVYPSAGTWSFTLRPHDCTFAPVCSGDYLTVSNVPGKERKKKKKVIKSKYDRLTIPLGNAWKLLSLPVHSACLDALSGSAGFELIYSSAGSDGGAGFASGNVPLFTIKQAGC